MNSLQFSSRRYLYTNFEFCPAGGWFRWEPGWPRGPRPFSGAGSYAPRPGTPVSPNAPGKKAAEGRATASIRYFQTSFSEVAGRKSRQFNWREFHPDFTTQKSGDKFSWIEQKMAVRLQTKTQTSSWTAVFPTETIQSQAQSLAFMKKFTVILW